MRGDGHLCLEAMADDLKPVYLLTGSDRPKIERAIKRLRARFDEDAFEQLTAFEAKGPDVVAACNSMGLFGGDSRLVLVTDVDGRRTADGRSTTGGLKAPDVEAIVEYLASPAPGTVLALVGEEVKADSTLGKAVKKKGDILAFDVSNKELPRWIRTQFDSRHVPVDIEACRRLIDLVGDDLIDLSNEIDRLCTWSDGEPVTRAVVDRTVFPRREPETFALTDAIGERDLAAALEAAEELLAAATSTQGELIKTIGLLANHVRRLLEVKALEAQGIGPRDAAAQTKRKPFYMQKLYEHASEYSPDELRSFLERLARLDHGLKGGSREPGELALSRMLVAAVSRPEPAGRRGR